MANQNSAKGNPASKRMSNSNLKARRERSWKRGQERKASRIRQQQAVHSFYVKERKWNADFRTVEELGQIIRRLKKESAKPTAAQRLAIESLETKRRNLRKQVREVARTAA